MMQMQQPPSGPPPAVLVFLKSMATPLVLYTPNTPETFAEIKEAMKNAKSTAPKLIEKETLGPLRQVFFWDTEIAGGALQMDMNAPPPQQGNPQGGGANPPVPPAGQPKLSLNPLVGPAAKGLMPPPKKI